METLFELSCQDQTLNPQIGTFTDASQTTGTFTLEDGEYYLTNSDTKGFYVYSPVAMQSGLVDDSKVIIEFDLKVVTASVNTHTIIGTYAGVDGNGVPTGDKITLQYNAGDIELVLGSGVTATLIESADVVVDQWYHFRIDCMLAAPLASTYRVKIDGVAVTTVTGAPADYELGIISVLGTDLHACDECGIKNITFVTETNLYVGRTALDQALQDVKGYIDNQVGACVPLTGSNQISGSFVPATDNNIDIGSSTNNIKMFYTKGITIDGTQFLPSDYIKVRQPRSELGSIIDFYSTQNNKYYDARIYISSPASTTSANSSSLLLECTGLLPWFDGSSPIGTASNRWGQIYSTNSAISTSDERQKDNIKQIDDKLLQAWGNVNIVQFNFKDALEKKGDNARLHTGYIAQNIQQACEENGVNPNDYGLFCFDSWEEQEEKKDENGEVIEPYRAKGDLYSLRYEEALVVECAYLRKKLKELTARIEQLEKGNNTK